MTTYSIDSLPIPVKTAGTSPLGTHEGTVTPPEPPTPTGTVYFSGKSTGSSPRDTYYEYYFDGAAAEHADKFFDKKVGDEVAVTVNGSTQTLAVYVREEGEDEGVIYAETGVGMFAEDIATLALCPQVEDGAWSYYGNIVYISAVEVPGGITLTIADA